MDGQRFDRLARSLAGSRSRRGALGFLAAGAGAVLLARLGLGEAAAACLRSGASCTADDECCSNQCDGPRIGSRTCRTGATSDICRRTGAPCDPNAGPGNPASCCAPGWCQASGGNDGYGGFLPAYTCRAPAGGCPDGRNPCPTRHFSGIGPQACCAPGDTCSYTGAGCVTSRCNINNESNQDVWATASCGGSEWCLCAITPEGGHGCADFSGPNICDNPTGCRSNDDCGPGQLCALLLPQWCGAWQAPGNNQETLRVCRPRCGNDGNGGSPPPTSSDSGCELEAFPPVVDGASVTAACRASCPGGMAGRKVTATLRQRNAANGQVQEVGHEPGTNVPPRDWDGTRTGVSAYFGFTRPGCRSDDARWFSSVCTLTGPFNRSPESAESREVWAARACLGPESGRSASGRSVSGQRVLDLLRGDKGRRQGGAGRRQDGAGQRNRQPQRNAGAKE